MVGRKWSERSTARAAVNKRVRLVETPQRVLAATVGAHVLGAGV